MTMPRFDRPIVFEPILMERVWGGRAMAERFGKALPGDAPYGESWELVDRDDIQSVVRDGPLAGKTLGELWREERLAVFGEVPDAGPRFPLLLKILDAREKLSIQVHPPAAVAAGLGGEPKTEMWYVADCDPGAGVYAGLKKGVTRAGFERALADGTVAEVVHRVEMVPGAAIFIPSGRVHALDAGNVIFEIQQNSDTTYRVFDWNRVGLDGKPRALHIEESMRSIDFDDFEPGRAVPHGELLVECEHFRVEKWTLDRPRAAVLPGKFAIFACVEGKIGCGDLAFTPGQFFLVPAAMEGSVLLPFIPPATVLRVTLP
jgi:mannose-6-phosphate isomerase